MLLLSGERKAHAVTSLDCFPTQPSVTNDNCMLDIHDYIVEIHNWIMGSYRKWQDYVYIQCEYKSTKQKIKHLLREENKVKENKISSIQKLTVRWRKE